MTTMITADTRPAAAPFAARLAAKARAMAEAHAEARVREARHDPWRWRKAGLLWPLFGKDR